MSRGFVNSDHENQQKGPFALYWMHGMMGLLNTMTMYAFGKVRKEEIPAFLAANTISSWFDKYFLQNKPVGLT
jgi:quinol-cytochrome oxidoreductase complex cytochrome b subunit